MTAKELINCLKELPPETHICVKGYEDGLDYVQLLREAKILQDRNNEWYYGSHEEVLDADSKHFDKIVWVIQ
jgi:hypothetical protein